MGNRLTADIAKEFLRVCNQADPTGQFIALYRQDKLLDELWREAIELAAGERPQAKKNLKSSTILS